MRGRAPTRRNPGRKAKGGVVDAKYHVPGTNPGDSCEDTDQLGNQVREHFERRQNNLAVPAQSTPIKRTERGMKGDGDLECQAASSATPKRKMHHASEIIHGQQRTAPAGRHSLHNSNTTKLGRQVSRLQLPERVDPTGQIRATIIRYSRESTRRVHWSNIAGLEDVKSALQEAVVLPSRRPDVFSGLRAPGTGMLLFGPPGTGKTMLAKAVATEAKSTFFSLSSSSMTSSTYGGNEKLVQDLFYLAKYYAPSIIFIDEIDALLSKRGGNTSEHEASRKTKTDFLTLWTDLECAVPRKEENPRRVFILGATNLPWEIDDAVLRRFPRRQYIPLPEEPVREQQLRKLFQESESPLKHDLCDSDFQRLANATKGKVFCQNLGVDSTSNGI